MFNYFVVCNYCAVLNYSPMLLFLTLQRHPDTPIIHIRHMNDWWRWGFAEGAGGIRFCLVLGGEWFLDVWERVGIDLDGLVDKNPVHPVPHSRCKLQY